MRASQLEVVKLQSGADIHALACGLMPPLDGLGLQLESALEAAELRRVPRPSMYGQMLLCSCCCKSPWIATAT